MSQSETRHPVRSLAAFAVQDVPVLAALLAAAGLKFVDVGGRGSAFGALLPLAPFADYYVSEPDAAEAERLQRQLPLDAPWRSVTVLSAAVGSRQGEARLHLTLKPGMSSLLEPDPEVTRRFFTEGVFRVVDAVTVPVVPLDTAASRYGFTDAAFLKLDTQGTELEILRSGSRLVRESLLAVHTESLFQPFYKGQSLFADVDGYLRDNGFALFSLNRTTLRRSGYRPSLYSKRVVTWAHCLYMREPETLLAAGPETLRRDLPRLLALALAFEHYDLSLEIVAIAGRVGLLPQSDLTQLAKDVERVATVGSERMLRKARRQGLEDTVMAPNFSDRKQLQ